MSRLEPRGPNQRRRALVALSAGSLAWARSGSSLAQSAWADPEELNLRIRSIENRVGGRLGVAALGAAEGTSFFYRADERFPFCSTFKWLATAVVLKRVDDGLDRLDRQVNIPHAIQSYAPVTRRYAGQSMSLSELCAAAIGVSDNTAGNLVLAATGGPGGFTRQLRGLGDPKTRSDRWEPDLNDAKKGDVRDTTTPRAMAENLRRMLLGEALSDRMRAQLTQWMLDCQTSGNRFRAGVPASWRVADKTGSGKAGTTNDCGVLFPANGPPICLSVYLTQSKARDKDRERALADVAALIART